MKKIPVTAYEVGIAIDYQEKTYAELAEEFGCSKSTIRRRYQEYLDELEKAYNVDTPVPVIVESEIKTRTWWESFKDWFNGLWQ